MKSKNIADVVYGEEAIVLRGIKLDKNELKNVYGINIGIILEKHAKEPVYSYVDKNPPALENSTSTFFTRLIARTHDWRLKRKMKKKNANFVYMQIGRHSVYYEFYMVE